MATARTSKAGSCEIGVARNHILLISKYSKSNHKKIRDIIMMWHCCQQQPPSATCAGCFVEHILPARSACSLVAWRRRSDLRGVDLATSHALVSLAWRVTTASCRLRHSLQSGRSILCPDHTEKRIARPRWRLVAVARQLGDEGLGDLEHARVVLRLHLLHLGLELAHLSGGLVELVGEQKVLRGEVGRSDGGLASRGLRFAEVCSVDLEHHRRRIVRRRLRRAQAVAVGAGASERGHNALNREGALLIHLELKSFQRRLLLFFVDVMSDSDAAEQDEDDSSD
mmetsp:Transcript_26719/g.62368  ORF Transcript_26719/g.62368 Transcript_26719/m.62368 type:complete len:283 (-) Transcript_26719:168-1016(-)